MYHRWLHQCFLERYACEKWMKKNKLLRVVTGFYRCYDNMAYEGLLITGRENEKVNSIIS